MARKLIVVLAIIVAVAIFIFQRTGVKIEVPTPPNATESGPSDAAIQAAETAIRAEPKVRDLLYQPGQAVEWQIGVLDDGTSRVGYANYICDVLGEHDALKPTTHVRIVDIVKVSAGSNFRAASLGHVACADRRAIVP